MENRVMKGMIVRQNQVLAECMDRIERLEIQFKQNTITISNLPKLTRENTQTVVTSFFSEVLGIQVDILAAYQVAKREPQQVIVKLKNPKDKGVIFKNV